MKRFAETYGPWGLVTGASAGIGQAMARELAARGLNIVAVARRERLLEDLAKELKRDYGVEVRAVPIDLAEPDAVSRIEAATRDLDIGLVIPNAGVEVHGEFMAGDLQRNNRMQQLNMAVPMQMAHVFGPKLAPRGRGGLLLVSSLFGYQGVPYVAHYAATKAFVLSLGEALNVELGRHGVDVTVLSPGLTDTTMPANMAIDFSKMPITLSTPEQVARVGIKALGRKATVIPGWLNKFYAWENRLLPRSAPVKLFGFLIRRAYKSAAAAANGARA